MDSKGDIYVASAGNDVIDIFKPSRQYLTSIANSNDPCAVAVNSKGELFVSESATGKVVRYKPNAYPFGGTPTYGAAEPIDSSGEAKGISVDSSDDRLYVARGDRIAVYQADGSFDANVGEPTLDEATGVAAYVYSGRRYVFVADPAGAGLDKVYALSAFSGGGLAALKFRKTITGPKAGEDFGFGTQGAYLAIDPGNTGAEGKCVSIAEQACTAGHLLVYDESHKAVDEFDATGEFLDQIKDPAFADAGPTGMAIDRSGGANDGTAFISAGGAAGSKLLAFGPLTAPSRAPLPQLSRELTNADQVAVDSYGNVYVGADTFIHVLRPDGTEIKVGPEGIGIEDTQELYELTVDSEGNVYVVDGNRFSGGNSGLNLPDTATYYTPSVYPPVDGTTYTRRETPILAQGDFPNPNDQPENVAVNPGDDHLYATGGASVIELDSIANESAFIRQFAPTTSFPFHSRIAVYGNNGNVYFANSGGSSNASVMNSAGTETLSSFNGSGGPRGAFYVSPEISVDQANGHLLMFQNRDEAGREYDASGAFVAEFSFPEPQGFTKELVRSYDIAIDNSGGPSDGRVYVAFDDTKPDTPDLWAFGPLTYGEMPLPETGVASGLGSGDATLNGTVNPQRFELTGCGFEYLSETAYLSNGKTFAGAATAPCAETFAEVGKGSAPVPVHADVSALNPSARYRFRLVAENKFGPAEGAAWLFGPPQLTPKSALPILYTEARLRADIDPSGLTTKYRFEYGTTESYGQSTPVAELAPADGPLPVKADLTGLAEGTTYHFRLVAENEAQSVPGPDQTLVTLARRPAESCPNSAYRTGLSAKLSDCRAYELVTPAETNGLNPFAMYLDSAGTDSSGFNNWLVTPHGEGAGERLAYFTVGTLPGFDGNGNVDGYRAERATGEGLHPEKGWSSEIFSPNFIQAAPDILHPVSQRSIAADQSFAFWEIEPAELLPGTLPEGLHLLTPNGFEPVGRGNRSPKVDLLAEGNYISPGGAHVIFSSEIRLENPAPISTETVYDRAAGAAVAQVVSIKPNGSSFDIGEDASYVGSNEAGTAILFEVEGILYVRRGGQTVEVAEAPNTFAGISTDGQRVFYTATNSGSTPAALFLCEVGAGSCAGAQASQAPIQIEPSSVFTNVSADGSAVLLTSKTVLPGSAPNEQGEEAEVGKDNLYRWDRETEASTFVARLSAQDSLKNWTSAISRSRDSGLVDEAPSRVTPDGDVFVFESHAQLTDYDNEGNGEIYRYDPAASPGERLTCVSCDPSGAPVDTDAVLVEVDFDGVAAKTIVPNLTEDGQDVFFESAERLLPEDANDAVDVYQWKANGAGNCTRPGGCLALISSGQGEADSHLYSMTPDGHDVFFHTKEKLVGQDVPGSPSIYDARVEGGIPDLPAPAPCQGDSCQGNGSTPPTVPSPASNGTGNGNLTESSKPRCPKGKRKVRRKGKVRCVKRHRHNREAGR